jgi:Flp pilus assembly pilin Flp
MRASLARFCRDERGCLAAMEWTFVASLLTLGAIAGLLAMQHSLDQFAEKAQNVSGLVSGSDGRSN